MQHARRYGLEVAALPCSSATTRALFIAHARSASRHSLGPVDGTLACVRHGTSRLILSFDKLGEGDRK